MMIRDSEYFLYSKGSTVARTSFNGDHTKLGNEFEHFFRLLKVKEKQHELNHSKLFTKGTL
jgi:hypothetical protein